MNVEKKEKSTRNYIECIINNRQQIDPLKSCEIGRHHKGSDLSAVYITNLQGGSQSKVMSVAKANQIFQPRWKEPPPVSQHKQEKEVGYLQKKNEQIANSLMKDKKSMSDIVYNSGQGKINKRYHNNIMVDARSSAKVEDRHKFDLVFPNIRRQYDKKVEESQGPMAMSIKSERQSDENQSSTPIPEPEYSGMTNVQIHQFLKLKQHAYKSDNMLGNNFELKKTKKMQKHLNKMAKKQRERLKNSLEEYLQTKIIPKGFRKGKQDEELAKSTQQDKKQVNTETDISKVVILKRQIDVSNPQLKVRKNLGHNKISKKNLLTGDPEVTVYEGKMKLYRQFLFLINLAHRVYHPIPIQDQMDRNQNRYKYYIGHGNNRQLIRALMKRRFWWTEVDNPMEANFVWTQLKINEIYEGQPPSKRQKHFYEGQVVIACESKSPTKKSYLYKAPLPGEALRKVLIDYNIKMYKNFEKNLKSTTINREKYQNFDNRLKFFAGLTPVADSRQLKVHNHLEQNFLIGNKKALFYNLRAYYQKLDKNVFDIVPLTFHIGQAGTNDPTFKEFIRHFKMNQLRKGEHNIWIVKPGQNSNRGQGISVFDSLYDINRIIKENRKSSTQEIKTFIIQKYIQKPLLYKGRKFDIRHYMLATKLHGKMRLYWFGEGYVRTSSFKYDIDEIGDIEIHLTNDAIQKSAQNYGKYEQGNKISYTELQRYFDANYPNEKYSIVEDFYPTAKRIALDAFKASYLHMDPRNLGHNFEIFGLDFMIDSDFNTWLIEVNTNPCLELNAGLLNRLIPNMLEHSLRLTIDPLFPPCAHYPNSLKHVIPDNPLDRLQYELIFDEGRDGREVQEIMRGEELDKNLENLEEDQDTYENDGGQMQIEVE